MSVRFSPDCLQARPYSYNYQVWTGGATAYSTCSLQTRGPEYLGSCSPRVNCTITTATVAGEVERWSPHLELTECKYCEVVAGADA